MRTTKTRDHAALERDPETALERTNKLLMRLLAFALAIIAALAGVKLWPR